VLPLPKHLLVAVLGTATLFALRSTIWPRLGKDVFDILPWWFNRKDILLSLLMDVVLAFFEECVFRGIPWVIFLLLIKVLGGRGVAVLLCGLIFLLLFNWLWTKGHGGTPHSRRAIFLSGLFYGWLLFWSKSIFVPITAHLIWNIASLVEAYWTRHRKWRRLL